MQETGTVLKHLKKEQLGLRHAISQAVALNAPAGTIVLYVSSTAALMYFNYGSLYPNGAYAIPLVLLLSLIVYGLMSVSMYEFSKELSSAGGYYTFVTRGLGSSAGFLTGIFHVTYQMLSYTGFGILGFVGFIYGILPELGVTLPYSNYIWIPIVLAFIVFVAGLIYSGIKPSLRYVFYAVILEVTFFIVTSLVLLARFHGAISAAPFTASSVGNDPLLLTTMMIYAIGTYVGVGGAIPIAEETSKPKRNVPLAIATTITILGITIILAAYSEVIAWGRGNMSTFGYSVLYPVLVIYQHDFGVLGPLTALLMVLIVVNSYFTATVSLGTNASRVLFSLSREKVIHSSLSDLDARTGVPKNAVVIFAIIAAVLVVVTGLAFERLYPNSPFDALTYASLFLLILESPIIYIIHILTNTSLYIYLKRNKKKISYFKHLMIPAISTITLIFAIVVAVYFDLTAPYIYGIYGALVWVVIVVLITIYVSKRKRERLELIGDFSL